MAKQNNIYANGIVAGKGIACYPHVDQSRDYKNDGKFKYDVSVIVTPDVAASLMNDAYQLAQQGVQAGVYQPNDLQSPFFHWPLTEISKAYSGKIIDQMFPGHWIAKLSRRADLGKPVVKDANGTDLIVPGSIRTGNIIACVGDFATYNMSQQNLGISFYLNVIYKFGEGTPFSTGGGDSGLDADTLAALSNAAAPTAAPGFSAPQAAAPTMPPGMPQAAPQAAAPGQPQVSNGVPGGLNFAHPAGGVNPATGQVIPPIK